MCSERRACARRARAQPATSELISARDDSRVTPWRIALILSGVITLVMAAIGVRSHDLYDGILRGLFDAAACLIGFAVLGRYLGLRAAAIE